MWKASWHCFVEELFFLFLFFVVCRCEVLIWFCFELSIALFKHPTRECECSGVHPTVTEVETNGIFQLRIFLIFITLAWHFKLKFTDKVKNVIWVRWFNLYCWLYRILSGSPCLLWFNDTCPPLVRNIHCRLDASTTALTVTYIQRVPRKPLVQTPALCPI